MGMLLRYHTEVRPEGEAKPPPQQAPTEVSEVNAYSDLTDEQVAEAYATNVGGRATKRETQEAALRELDADQPTEGGSENGE